MYGNFHPSLPLYCYLFSQLGNLTEVPIPTRFLFILLGGKQGEIPFLNPTAFAVGFYRSLRNLRAVVCGWVGMWVST